MAQDFSFASGCRGGDWGLNTRTRGSGGFASGPAGSLSQLDAAGRTDSGPPAAPSSAADGRRAVLVRGSVGRKGRRGFLWGLCWCWFGL